MIGGRLIGGGGCRGGLRRRLNSSAACRAARSDTGFSYFGPVPPGGIRNGGSGVGSGTVGGTVGAGKTGGMMAETARQASRAPITLPCGSRYRPRGARV